MSGSFRHLVRVSVPATAWTPILAGSAGLLVVTTWARLTAHDHPLTATRPAILACVSGLAFAFEDPAAATTAPCPVPLRVRCASWVAVPLIVVSSIWCVSVVVAPLAGREIQLLAAETSALAALAAAVALVALRRGARRPGLVAGPLLFGLMLLSARLETRPLLPYDVAAHASADAVERAVTRSGLVTAFAAVTIFAATADPVSRRRRRVAGISQRAAS